MIQFQQIIYFLKIAELRSINKAAAKLYVSQPRLCQSIKNLEDELNIRLFRRSNKGVVLTEDGKRFLQYAERIADQMELIEGLAREKRENRLSVALYPMVSTAKLIADFYEKEKENPIEIFADEYRLSKVIDLVYTSAAELGIIQVNMGQRKEFFRELKKKSLDYAYIQRGTWHIIVDKSHPLAGRKEIYMEELRKYPIIRARDDLYSGLSCHIKVEDYRWGDFEKIFFANDGLTRLALLKSTGAFLTCPTWCLNDYLEYEVSVLELKGSDLDTELGWICRKKEDLTRNARRFIEIVQEYFRSVPE